METWVKTIGSIIVLLIVGILHWLILWQILPQTSVKSVPSPQQPLVVNIINDSLSVNSEQKITPIARVTKPKRIKKKQIKKRKKVNKPKKTRRRTRKKSRTRHRVSKPTSIKTVRQPKPIAHSFSKSTNTSQKVTSSHSKQNSRFAKSRSSFTTTSSAQQAIPNRATAPITSQKKTLNRVTTKKNHHTITTPLFLGGKPPYPLLSKRRGEQGTVLLKVKVNAQGQAMTTQIKQSSGFSRLDNAAVKHITNGSFKPAQRGGKSIIGWKEVKFVFQLN